MAVENKMLTRMDLRKGRYIILVLSESGGKYFKCDHWGRREVYYVTETHAGCIHGIFIFPPAIEGKFIFEMEAETRSVYPSDFLKGISSQNYLRGIRFFEGDPCDPSIGCCDRLTVEEIAETEKRLNRLRDKFPAHADAIGKLLDDLQSQRRELMVMREAC